MTIELLKDVRDILADCLDETVEGISDGFGDGVPGLGYDLKHRAQMAMLRIDREIEKLKGKTNG